MMKIAAGFLTLLLVGSVLVPNFSGFEFDQQNVEVLLSPPTLQNWFGTDNLGRDLFTRTFYGARISLTVALVTSSISLCIALVLGGFSGYWGGSLDRIVMRFIDIFQSIPPLVLMLLMTMLIGEIDFGLPHSLHSILGIILALSLVSWGGLSRLIRGQSLQIKESPYVEAARSLGAGHLRLVTFHILPNLLGPLLVLLTYQIPSLILYESFLSFIGLGLQPPYASWGVLANEGWRSFRTYPHLIFFPGVFMFLTMLSFNIIGDRLRNYKNRAELI